MSIRVRRFFSNFQEKSADKSKFKKNEFPLLAGNENTLQIYKIKENILQINFLIKALLYIKEKDCQTQMLAARLHLFHLKAHL